MPRVPKINPIERFNNIYLERHSSTKHPDEYKREIFEHLNKTSRTEEELHMNLNIISFFLEKEPTPSNRSFYASKFLEIMKLTQNIKKHYPNADLSFNPKLFEELTKKIEIRNNESRFNEVSRILDKYILHYKNTISNQLFR